ncbi:MAG: hypothetical protein MMC33_007336 [Icmadophila ericetorum]|nr:hypothetical protein [Icmadophila ericetorum]
MPAVRTRTELQTQKTKLANSYQELLEEFSSIELRTVGNYNLGRLIGKGSFGKVYLATHKLTNGSKVVLKSAKKDDANLAREIHHHRQFTHPHIARLYEVIVTESLVWLVLEYCPGDELYNYILKNGPLPIEKAQRIFTQLVGAVAYVHNKNCVHRDLKLENILLDKHENVKLVDFGFTREYEGKLSYLQTFCGTVCYSAPEMLRGEKYAGEKVDVWSLGIILYSLLTGELPFDEDDDIATKHKILTTEPKYPDSIPADAKVLLLQLLSKRPLIRPSLADILTNPFLAEHAPAQQAILKLAQPAPFSSKVEKETLERMRSAGVDIDQVIEHVLAQRCDALAGWWALLSEKEERKEKRREQKRKEKEQEVKSLRRISGASSRLERIAPTLEEVNEESHASPILETPRSRGRRERRSFPTPQLVIPELPRLPEGAAVQSSPGSPTPPPPIEKDYIRSASSSRQRPPLPPKERRASRGSQLQLVSSRPVSQHLVHSGITKRRPQKRHHAIFSQIASIKQWFVDSTKRGKSPGTKSEASTLKAQPERLSPDNRRSPALIDPRKGSSAKVSPNTPSSPALRAPVTRIPSSHQRLSVSPSPLTPHSSYNRRSSANLRGRKSTSSSVSSIRSIHHVHSHSKASSTSSNSNSIVSSAITNIRSARSPHTSVKVLPATPTTSSFPSNIRVSRGSIPSPISTGGKYNESSSTFGPLASPGLIFAKRKKTPFRGPTLHTNTSSGSSPSASAGRRDSSVGSRSASAAGRRSGEPIQEEDEDEVEEVDAFSPIDRTGATEVEETIWEGNEGGMKGWLDYTEQ